MLAEPGDDISTLDIPAETTSETSTTNKSSSSSPNGKETPETSSSTAHKKTTESTDIAKRPASAPSTPMRYPFYPSVIQLLHENGLSKSDADSIPATGPNGRLLKGDVLAYLGAIGKSYPKEQSARITELGHLDLSNIRIVQTQQTKDHPPKKQGSDQPLVDQSTEVTVNISLGAVRNVQERVKSTLGIEIPLEKFITRAVIASNDDLPRSNFTSLSTDELFNQVLGLDKVNTKTSRGSFVPQITALPAHQSPMRHDPKKEDILDFLCKPSSISKASNFSNSTVTTWDGSNIAFSVETRKVDEWRAKVFLERLKAIIQKDPGQLISL